MIDELGSSDIIYFRRSTALLISLSQRIFLRTGLCLSVPSSIRNTLRSYLSFFLSPAHYLLYI